MLDRTRTREEAMYKHAREVSTGLILSLVTTAIAGLVAWADPWHNGVPWVNWLVISTVMVILVAAATALSAFTREDEEYFNSAVGILFMWVICAGLVVAMITKLDALEPRYHSLAWSAYSVPMGTFILAAMIQYLVGARAVRGNNRSDRLNRLA